MADVWSPGGAVAAEELQWETGGGWHPTPVL